MTDELSIAHLRQWIGRTESRCETITPHLVERLSATLDDARAPSPDAALPLLLHWCLTQPSMPMSGLGADGHPARGDFLPPVPLPQRMWAGGALTFHDTLRIGDAVTRLSRIADVSVKEGRTGTLCFVTVQHEIRTARGRAVQERQDIVYRDIGRETPPLVAGPEPVTPHRLVLEADSVRLFRYSALTFNGHRIHYDRAYAMDVEGYGGLVVHGPLQATLLAEHARAIAGRAPKAFSFRGLRPLLEGTLTLDAVEGDRDMELWTADGDGRRTMSAKATW